MDLVFRCRASLHIPRNGKLSLGRSKPVGSWDNVLISRNHVQLHLEKNGAVLDLSVTGRNAVVVERQLQDGGDWDVVTVVDPGGSALLPVDGISGSHATRFFVLGAREESAVELRLAAHPPELPAAAKDDHPAKRQCLGAVPTTPAARTATAAANVNGAAASVSAPSGSSSLPRGGWRPMSVAAATTIPVAPKPKPGAAASGRVGTEAAAGSRTPAGQPSSAASYDIESPIHLLRVRGLAPAFNSGRMGVHFRRLVSGPLQLALVSNFMVDMGWLLSCCPDLVRARQLFVLHGEQPDSEPEMRQQAAAAGARHLQLHRPPLPIPYGTHHSKAFLLTYPTGLRLVVHTANCVSPDCNDKTQGVWVQDFPRKQQGPATTTATAAAAAAAAAGPEVPGSSAAAAGAPASSSFERDLAAYFRALALPSAMAGPVFEAIAAHDFSHARGALVASVPGYHRGTAAVQSYGHMRLRRLLERVPLPAGFQGSSDGAVTSAAAPPPAAAAAAAANSSPAASEGLIIQCSSMGSFDQEWLVDEMGASLAAHRRPQGQQRQPSSSSPPPRPSGPPGYGPLPLAVVWPTVEEVRNSIEGWNAGLSIPGPSKNVCQAFMRRYYARWGGEAVGRQRAMPHIKTYTRYRGQQLAWFLVTSHNLSKAAWGVLQKGGSQLMIRSYELGVLVTPALEAAYRASPQFGFCCDDDGSASPHQRHTAAAAAAPLRVVTFWTLAGATAGSGGGGGGSGGGSGGGGGGSGGSAPTEARSASLSGGGELACALPVPYPLPPTSYQAGVDEPWTVDTRQPGLDALGLPHGSPYSHYGHTQQD
ncbi:hypothetical protein PLESTB_000815500 [Pleodorina starrii]|uniref:Tyrosyl-DNA phosphodiesterase 1 n=1 Tax=Pleodorina starrii TaxID=330485 RepID=A0A9W6BLC8_9CHLO|nr:hypothetical protein PLESTM_000131200 [Pleodorina starrii]GLC54023.1 hypothetical protein PLESTB_000815500 [Pleodorina starrii]GLC64671.1 hypothetical protein PLESTF_000190800 [Pleodorina starrii]